MVNGRYNTIRKALSERGWFEKSHYNIGSEESRIVKGQITVDDLYSVLPRKECGMTRDEHIQKCEDAIVARILQNYEADLYWKRDSDNVQQKSAIHSRFPYSRFACKPGLCAIMQEMQWYIEPNVSFAQFPRCYNPSLSEQLDAFKDDFKLTACMSLLKHYIKVMDNLRPGTAAGLVPGSVVAFAIDRCRQYIGERYHTDLDHLYRHPTNEEWDKFFNSYQQFVHKKKKCDSMRLGTLGELRNGAIVILKEMERVWPQYDLDGMMNIWVVKPGYNCRGRGIRLMNNYQQILDYVTPNATTKVRYVIQKYLERPLLIYNTKFDIRQWFLITSVDPLYIWMYRECYLRFSTQNFSLTNFHEAIHLTNNAVQKKYKPKQDRHPELPKESMWSSKDFCKFLVDIGHPEKWQDIIYKGMRQGIVGAMLSSQEHMVHRSNSFQLYGADFILDSQFSPWLLEINSCPDMGGSTTVTSRLCPQCLEDVIKVVIDRRSNRDADTGLFDCIYKQDKAKAVMQDPTLLVEGKKVKRVSRYDQSKEKGSGETPPQSPLNIEVQPKKMAISEEVCTISHRGDIFCSRGTNCRSRSQDPPGTSSSGVTITNFYNRGINIKTEDSQAYLNINDVKALQDITTLQTIPPKDYVGPVIADLIGVLQGSLSGVSFTHTEPRPPLYEVTHDTLPKTQFRCVSPVKMQTTSVGTDKKDIAAIPKSGPTNLQMKLKIRDSRNKKKHAKLGKKIIDEKPPIEVLPKKVKVNASSQYYILDTFLKKTDFTIPGYHDFSTQT